MAIYIKEIDAIIRMKDMEYMNIAKVLVTKENGRMINKMDME